MDFVKIKSLIREQEQKPLMSPDSLGLPKYSIKEIVDCLKLAKKYYRADNNCSLNVLCPAELRAAYQKQLLQLIDQATQENFLSLFNQFPCSFRVTNIQLYCPSIKNHHHIGFKDEKCLFNANLYFTPGLERNALHLHFDNEILFIHQLIGQKQWHLIDKQWHANTSLWGLRDDLSAVYLDDIQDKYKQSITLKKNDVMFLPPITPHQAIMVNNIPSIHLTYGFKRQTGNLEFYNFFIQKLSDTLYSSPSTREIFTKTKSLKDLENSLSQIDLNALGHDYMKRAKVEDFNIFRYGYPYGKYHLRENVKTD